jgi:hypothetical protein
MPEVRDSSPAAPPPAESVREYTGEAEVRVHCCVLGVFFIDAGSRLLQTNFGLSRTQVTQYRVGPVEPYAQYKHSITLDYHLPKAPRKRKVDVHWVRVYDDDLRYVTVHAGDKVLYDSRTDVPCDMAKWRATWERFYKEYQEMARRDGNDVLTPDLKLLGLA